MTAQCNGLQTYFSIMYEPTDIVEVRMIRGKEASSLWFTAETLDDHVTELTERNRNEWNIYAGPNPRTRVGGRCAGDVALYRAVFVDFDNMELGEVHYRLSECVLPNPTMLIGSGHGFHCYWCLEEPIHDSASWRECQRYLISTLKSDPAIHDPPRIMRLPGLLNWKQPGTPVTCRMIAANRKDLYPIDEFINPETERSECAERAVGVCVTERSETSEMTEDTETSEMTENTETSETAEDTERTDPFIAQLSQCHQCPPQSPSLSVSIETAITETLPSGPGRRNQAAFEFARALKAIPSLADADPFSLRPHVLEWHRQAYDSITTKPFDDTWADFLKAWPKIKFPKGKDPMSMIMARVEATEPPPEASEFDAPETQRLVTICMELQRAAGEGPFFLSCRTAGKLVGLEHTTAWRRLFLLQRTGIIKTVVKGTRSKAARYRYVGPSINEEAGS